MVTAEASPSAPSRLPLARIAGGLLLVAAVTYTSFRLVTVNALTVGFEYLIVILLLAARWGLVEAVIASVASVLCFNFFFLPPIGTFTISDPENWVALLAFLVTAIIASRLSDQAKRRTREAMERQFEMERLYTLSRAILLTDPEQSIPRQVTHHVAESFGIPAVVLYDRATGEFHRSGPEDFPGLDEQFRASAVEGTRFQTEGNVITAIRLGSEPIGSIGISRADLSDSALQGLVNLVAIGLESARARHAATRAEASRQSDELKSTLLDAIAHEFKTPLTTIKVATSALLSEKASTTERQRTYVALIDEETDRLNALVTDAIQMARLEGRRVQLHGEQIDIARTAGRVLEKMKAVLADHTLEKSFPPELPTVPADPELVELVFRQLISNAAKYSAPQSSISISAEAEQNGIVVSVRDRGHGIPENEVSRVFEKFYRGRSVRQHVPGAGLGLFIASEIVHAHGGDMWVESKLGEGSVFRFSLPFRYAAGEEVR